jgi:hypothetical protein
MMGQVGHEGTRGRAVPAIAVLLAAVLLAAVALAALRSDTAGAPTVLVEGAAATVVLPDGTRRPLDVGAQVPPGATVAAGPGGAVLRTRDRDVHLGRRTQVTVVDGRRQQLATGVVMVDARRGPGVDVETAAAVVTTPDGAVSRLERGALVRVGTFDGDAVSVRPTGRRTTTELARWTQTQVPVGGLPGRVTPLKLTGDRIERRLAPDLVRDDRTLADLGRTLDNGGAQGPAVLAALEDALPAAVVPAPVVPVAGLEVPTVQRGPASERALAFLLAGAAEAGAEPAALRDVPTDVLAERYAEVRALRADGGSWGPVARLVGAPVPAVGGLLDGLLTRLVLVAGELPAPVDLAALLAPRPVIAAQPATSPAAPGPAGGPTPASGDAPPPPPANEDDDEGDPVVPTDPPGPVPTPPPVPTLPPLPPPLPPDPVGTVSEAVDTVVDTVIGLLPDLPVPVPTPSPTPPVPLPGVPLVDPPVLEPVLR